MSDVILKVENVSKLYRLGTVGTGTFGGDVQRFWKTKILGQEDPFLKIGQTNDRTSKEKADLVWALQDINFEVKRGEVLGIIGKNGAGKSTLLKLLSRITSPTTGSIKSSGRMASLLEVGTGFHPELTGRENIFLNGAILGMTKKEIQSKFDEIVDFSGCELYIDTPVKRYSSGMTVRLGFAVAAFLDPEILVVDEVLAVGDAEFQSKALRKMNSISKSEGRTILFVSHNLAAVQTLCSAAIILNNGKLIFSGNTDDSLKEYNSLNKPSHSKSGSKINKLSTYNLGKGKFVELLITDEFEMQKFEFNFQDIICFKFVYNSLISMNGITVSMLIKDDFGSTVLMATPGDFYESISLDEGNNFFELKLNEHLMPGNYFITLSISYFISGESLEYVEDVGAFSINKFSKLKNREFPWNTIHGKIKPNSKIIKN